MLRVWTKHKVQFCNCKHVWLQTAICTGKGLIPLWWFSLSQQVCPNEISISKCESFRAETVWEEHCGANVPLLPIHETKKKKKRNKQKKNAPRLTSASPVRAKLGSIRRNLYFLERRVLIERGLKNLLYIIHVYMYFLYICFYLCTGVLYFSRPLQFLGRFNLGWG